ncbi:cytochrome P450 monooxygenase-like protein [Podospora aff. communis PSN243]|uniref:Cytochrome P450 monooxygenase-like protein n=1 Tax=Podospora aff. communis PSN243 TaxID=3040156 RepID=A0AAV9GTC4_9PEZI|nr:cytochrome P450 monooxygenase-like protein [Podospora aff. communis PSN243]
MIDLLLVVGVHGTLCSLFHQSANLPAGLDAHTTWLLSLLPFYIVAKTTIIPGRLVVQGLAGSLAWFVKTGALSLTSGKAIYLQSAGLYVVVSVLVSIYIAFLGPLRKVPGPLFAKLSSYYLPYHLLYRSTNFTTLFTRLHAQYGPIVRIGPDEVHVATLDGYNRIYNQRFDKEPALYKCFGEDESSFGELTYAAMKVRKDRLSGLFTRSGVKGLEHVIRANVDRTIGRILQECTSASKSIDFFLAMRCLAVDVITTFCFAKKIDAVDTPGFRAPIILAMEASIFNFLVFMNFPIVNKMLFSLPMWLSRLTAPELNGLFDLQVLLQGQIDELLANPKRLESVPHKTIYHPLLETGTRKSLYEEGQAMLFAGTDTVSNTAMLLVYYVLQNPDIETKLLDELRTVWPDKNSQPPSWDTLEKLPYLSAVIKEALRLTPGVAAGLKRVVGKEGIEVEGIFISAGTIIHSSGHMLNLDEKLWEEPRRFKPERWLVGKEERRDMEARLVTFSKGPRMCMGINLAYCELYIAVATMFRKLEMKVDGTTEKDIWSYRECFIPWYYGEHMRVVAKERTD